jgi:site-specific DNA recombinase
LEHASSETADLASQLHAAEQAILDAQRQLNQYRAALGAGADPIEVTAWINQATAAKAAAEADRARLRAITPTRLDRAALRRILSQAGGLVTALDSADHTRRAALYDKLGIEGVYQPTERLVVITTDLVCQWLVSEVRPQPLAYPRLSTTLAL